MGLCGSTVSDDGHKVGSTATSPSDVTVDVNTDDEAVVYADTVRLVSTLMLKRLTAMLTGDSIFDQLAAGSMNKDVTAFALVASDQWSAYYKAVWDCKAANESDSKDPATRFAGLLNYVESGASYKRPGHSIASQSASLQLLNAALVAQTSALEGAANACSETETAAKDALNLWVRLFGVFGGGNPLKLMDNIDQITAS